MVYIVLFNGIVMFLFVKHAYTDAHHDQFG